MAASGVGRGRGWLNLNKQQRPGGTPESVEQEVVSSTLGQLNITEYSKLISQINMLNENDDGILLNQKLKAIIEVWEESCKTVADVKQSVSCIYQACLTKDEFASKVVDMVTANTFATQKICDTKIRNAFVSMCQRYFESKFSLDYCWGVLFIWFVFNCCRTSGIAFRKRCVFPQIYKSFWRIFA